MINERFEKAPAPADGFSTWADIASQGYEQIHIIPVVSHKPGVEPPLSPLKLVPPLREFEMSPSTPTPAWRFNDGCSQVLRKPGAE